MRKRKSFRVVDQVNAVIAIWLLLCFALATFASDDAEASHYDSAARKYSESKTAKTSCTNTSKAAIAPLQQTAHSRQRFGYISLLGPQDEQLLQHELVKHIGIGYKLGGTGLDGFDCSGFTRNMYRKLFGIDLPRNSQSQFRLPGLLNLDDAELLKAGDLIFFSATEKKKRINHVGIYLDEGRFIHALTKRGVIVSSIDNNYWRSRLVSGKRIDSAKIQISEAFDSEEDFAGELEKIESKEPSGLLGSCASNSLGSFAHKPLAIKGSPGFGQHLVSISYLHSVFLKYCELQVCSFPEYCDIRGFADGLHSAAGNPGAAAGQACSYSQGIGIVASVKPFCWMSITPSLTRHQDNHELDCFAVPKQALGLELSLGPPNECWSLSTGLRYVSMKKSAQRLARTGDPEQLDMSLICSRLVAERLQLSLMGQRLLTSIADARGNAGSCLSIDRRLFFLLNFNY